MNKPKPTVAIFVFSMLLMSSALSAAGEADVTNVTVRKSSDGRFNFNITVRSNDKGWNYYVDSFEVLSPDGKVLVTHKLLHPHDDEQPFTRDTGNVSLPAGIRKVIVRAHIKPAGYNGATFPVDLP